MENQAHKLNHSKSNTLANPNKVNTITTVAYLALILSVLVIAGLIAAYFQANKLINQLQQNTYNLHQRGENTDLEQRNDITKLQQQVADLSSKLTNLQEMSKGNVSVWRFSEAKYLVQLAYYHLTFTQDIPAAVALLQTAEQRVAAINDPSLMPIRQAIANNIAALQAVPKIDLASLLTRITALQMQVTKLPTVGLPSTKLIEQPDPNKSVSPLKKAISDSWETLQKIVVIRNQDQGIHPLLSPEQQAYLQQNLQLILQQAQWAALRGQGAVYQSSLRQARAWVENYFARNLPATQAFIQAISDLQKINVQPTIPDLTPMVQKIQQVAVNPKTTQAG